MSAKQNVRLAVACIVERIAPGHIVRPHEVARRVRLDLPRCRLSVEQNAYLVAEKAVRAGMPIQLGE